MFKGIYTRKYYFDKIKGFIKNDIIKVITGIKHVNIIDFISNDLTLE